MELFRQAVLGYTGQAMLGSKFQTRDMGLSLSTKEYATKAVQLFLLQRKLLARPWVVVVISLVMMVLKMIVMMKVVVIVVAAAGVSRDRGPMRWWQWRRSGRR